MSKCLNHLINTVEWSVGNGLRKRSVTETMQSMSLVCFSEGLVGRSENGLFAVREFQQGRDISKTCREKSQQPLSSTV